MKYLEQHDCFIDEDGNVYLVSLHNGWHYKDKMFTAPMWMNRGYWFVRVRKNNIPLHRLMAEAFIPNPDSLPCVDHINRIRTDNSVENLRWVSHKDNGLNSGQADRCMSKYGVHCKTDSIAYKKAYYQVNKDRLRAYDKEKRDQKRAEGYRYRLDTDGKHRWLKVG